MNFEAWLAANGFDATTITAAQRIALEAAWRREQNPAPAPTPTPAPAVSALDFDQLIATAAARNEHKDAITALVAQYLDKDSGLVAVLEPIGRLAIAGKWSMEQTELALLRASRSAGPTCYSKSEPKVDDEVIEVAMIRAAGGVSRESLEASYSDQTLSAADKQFRSGCGLQRLLVMAAQANGYRDAGHGDWGRTLRAAFHDSHANGNYNLMASGPSTFNVPTILSNVGNKYSVDAFNAVESVWRRITATRPVNDFKEITGVALTGDMTYKEIPAGGKLEHSKFGEEVYGNRAKNFGTIIGIDYVQIRNDDLNTFAKANRMLGRGGALTINQIFWKEFIHTNFDGQEGGKAYWVAGENARANADVAMTLEGLAKAHEYWAARTDPQKNPMGDQAKFLLVPASYDLAARRFMRSTKISNDDGEGEENVLAGKWEPLSSTYLSNTAMGANASAITYYLLADPNDMPVIETVFLDGQEVPTIESSDMEFSRLGIEMRARHGFGVRKQEKRGGYRFKTTA